MPDDTNGGKPSSSVKLSSKRKSGFGQAAWISYLVYACIRSFTSKQHSPFSAIYIPLTSFLLIVSLLAMLPRRWVSGGVVLRRIDSLDFDRRIQERYQPEINDLKMSGFNFLFSVGDSISIFRLAWILPAIMILQLWIKKLPMTILPGAIIQTGNPVLISKNKDSYVSQTCHGCTFRTAFRDGSQVISRNFGDDWDDNRSSMVIHGYKGASISDTWSKHQYWIGLKQSENNPIDRQNGFDFYYKIVKQESIAIGVDIYKKEKTN